MRGGKNRSWELWASENIAGARRRLLRGYKIEKRQHKPAPCAPALFISPPACSASVTPARLPTPHINSKQRLDGKTRVAFEAQIPPAWPFAIRATFTGLRLQSARDRCNLQEIVILISALVEVGQQLNDRLRLDRNLTTVCHRAVFARVYNA
jgi:hypothetical protein